MADTMQLQLELIDLRDQVAATKAQLQQVTVKYEAEVALRASAEAEVVRLRRQLEEQALQMRQVLAQSAAGSPGSPMPGSPRQLASPLTIPEDSAAIAAASVAKRTAAVPKKSGYLLKQGEHIRNWRKRWLVLEHGTLSYFKAQNDTEPRGAIYLESWEIREQTEEEAGGVRHTFVLTHAYFHTIPLCAETDHQMREWIKALAENIAFCNGNRIVSESLTAPKKIDMSDLEEMRSFDAFMHNPTCCQYFKQFLQQEFSAENFLFWQDVCKFETMDVGPDQHKEGQRIYDTYISADADMQVNLSSEITKPIEKRLTTGTNALMFVDAKIAAFQLMRSNSFNRFQESKLCRDLVYELRTNIERAKDRAQLELQHATSPSVRLYKNVAKFGWLNKQGQVVRTWRPRWVVLADGALHYFRSPSDTEEKGAVPLDGCTVEETTNPDTLTNAHGTEAFHFTLFQPGRIQHLASEYEFEGREWMTAIRMVAKQVQSTTSDPASPNLSAGLSASASNRGAPQSGEWKARLSMLFTSQAE